MRITLKILAFVALTAAYYAFAGSTAWRTSFGIRVAGIYEAGAIIALWVGGRPIGTLQPVSLRPIFIGLGVFLMLAGFVLMLTTRDIARGLERGASYQAAPDPAIALELQPTRPVGRVVELVSRQLSLGQLGKTPGC